MSQSPLCVIPLPEPEQPRPATAKVWSESIAGIDRQIIARTWRGDDWKRCRLCPRGFCNVADGLCMVAYPTILPTELCALRPRVH